jgi:hypothetical protein
MSVEGSPVKAFLETFAAILGALTIALLLASISHEYGYFLVIGRHFQALVTTSDYFANVILWMPVALLTLYWVFRSSDFKERSTGNQQVDELKPAGPFWRRWYLFLKAADGRTRMRALIWTVAGLTFITFAVLIMSWPPRYSNLFIVALILISPWMRMWPNISRAIVALPEDFQAMTRQLLKVGVPVLAIMAFMGAAAAVVDLESKSTYDVYLKSSPDRAPRAILRALDKGLLLRNPKSNRIEFERWDNISRIESEPFRPTDTIGCNWIAFLCVIRPDAVAPPPASPPSTQSSPPSALPTGGRTLPQ